MVEGRGIRNTAVYTSFYGRAQENSAPQRGVYVLRVTNYSVSSAYAMKQRKKLSAGALILLALFLRAYLLHEGELKSARLLLRELTLAYVAPLMSATLIKDKWILQLRKSRYIRSLLVASVPCVLKKKNKRNDTFKGAEYIITIRQTENVSRKLHVKPRKISLMSREHTAALLIWNINTQVVTFNQLTYTRVMWYRNYCLLFTVRDRNRLRQHRNDFAVRVPQWSI